MRAMRLLCVALLVIALAPGTFVRTATGLRSDPAVVTVAPVDPGPPPPGPLRLTGAWRLDSPHGWFGGFSALVTGEEGRLIAANDRGFLFAIDIGRAAPRAVAGSFRFVARPVRPGSQREVLDLEALARDPESGRLWAAYETFNMIERFDPGGTRTRAKPLAMGKWRMNSGPEAMTRLADGRFLVIAEDDRAGAHPALLFPADPVDGGEPLAFTLPVEGDFDPVDAAQLPDGRVLILLRAVDYRIPARFTSAIAIADPAAIRAGEPWRASIIQRLPGAALAENYEGIAFVPDPAQPAQGQLWLIADDNMSVFQRSLLLRFAWRADNEKAPGNPERLIDPLRP
jgi:hypothetical protein